MGPYRIHLRDAAGPLISVIALQVTWFACALGAARDALWPGLAAACLAILLHLARAPQPEVELRLILGAGAVGIVAESLFIQSGVARYALSWPFESLAPIWLIALWMTFATTLNTTFVWLRPRPLLAAAVGAIGAPAAYFGGARLGAMHLADPVWLSLVVIGAVWAVALPLLIAMARRWDGTIPATGHTVNPPVANARPKA